MRTHWIGLCALLLAAPALAQPAPGEPDVPGEPGTVRVPPAPVFQIPGPQVPDASLRAMKDRWAVLKLRNGTQITGRIIAVEEQTVTLVVPPGNDVVTFEKASVVGLRAIVIAPEPAAVAPVAPPEPPGKPRHYGIGLGVAPSVAFDVDHGLFYGFVNGGILVPLVTGGTGIALSVGAGVNFPVSRGSNWRFEVFGHYSPLRTDQYNNQWLHAVGAGVGIHYTARNGFTFGFKLPVLGYSAYSTSTRSGSVSSAGEAVALYYLGAAATLPLAMVGYRF